MPIELSYTTSQEVSAHYHFVTGADADFIDNRAVLTIETYLDESAFKKGAEPLEVRRRTVSGDSYSNYFARSVLQELGKDPVTQAEKYLVNATQEFSSGTIITTPSQG